MATWHHYILVSVSAGELGTARLKVAPACNRRGLFWNLGIQLFAIITMADPPSLSSHHTVPGAYGAESIAKLLGAGRSCELFPHLFWGPLKFCCCSEI